MLLRFNFFVAKADKFFVRCLVAWPGVRNCVISISCKLKLSDCFIRKGDQGQLYLHPGTCGNANRRCVYSDHTSSEHIQLLS